jgi:hypothetical protein
VSGKTLGLGVIAIAPRAFVRSSCAWKAPLIRLGIFRLRTLSAGNVACCSSHRGSFPMFYFASIYLQEVRVQPVQAGLPSCRSPSIVIGAGAPQALIKRIGIPRLVRRHDDGAAGMLYLTQLDIHSNYFTSLFPSIVVMSIVAWG